MHLADWVVVKERGKEIHLPVEHGYATVFSPSCFRPVQILGTHAAGVFFKLLGLGFEPQLAKWNLPSCA